ncbi:MAG: hypothetical protein MUF15_20850 [Acidobacteria bacterium]|jgi:hypothetical protein|nr:hypothetical protein [Acidobacteriota bacterium]
MTLEEIIQSIHSIENYLQKFEEKYKLRSDDFYKMVQQDKLEHTPDFLEWLGIYEIKLKREKQYHKEVSDIISSKRSIKLPLDKQLVEA